MELRLINKIMALGFEPIKKIYYGFINIWGYGHTFHLYIVFKG